MTVAHGRTELDALSRTLRGFIQSVAKPAYHVQDANLSVGGEYHVQQYFALDPKLASLGVYTGVGLLWIETGLSI